MQLSKKACNEIEQVNKKLDLKSALTLATTALLGTSTLAHAQEANLTDNWQFDTAFLYYGESDRVTAAEGIFGAIKTFSNDEILSLKF